MSELCQTAGESIELRCELEWLAPMLAGTTLPVSADRGAGAPGLRITIEGDSAPFVLESGERVSRSAWRGRESALLTNVVGSGFDLYLEWHAARPTFRFRWRPPVAERLAALALPGRFRLLARQVVVHYPALWRAGLRGRVPLHAAACAGEFATVLLAGAGGLGKSTLLAAELARGASLGSDNMCVSDGFSVWPVIEPMRLEEGTGPRAPHGRREAAADPAATELWPDRLVIPRRAGQTNPRLRRCDAAQAGRVLAAGTYAAGELRRYWGFVALVMLATGRGPAHPPVSEVAAELGRRLPTYELLMPERTGPWLSEVLLPREAIA